MSIALDLVHRTACGITADHHLRQDVEQEMLLYLESHTNGTESYRLRGAKFRAFDYLRRGRSVDSGQSGYHSPSRITHYDLVSTDAVVGGLESLSPATASCSPATSASLFEVLDKLDQRLTRVQQAVLGLLLQEYGIREIARKLGVSHVRILHICEAIRGAARTVQRS